MFPTLVFCIVVGLILIFLIVKFIKIVKTESDSNAEPDTIQEIPPVEDVFHNLGIESEKPKIKIVKKKPKTKESTKKKEVKKHSKTKPKIKPKSKK